MNEMQAHIQNTLRSRRDYFGISNSELARRSGLNKNTVAKILNGHTNPSAIQVLSLAFCLDVSFDDLIPPSLKRLRSQQREKRLPACMPGCQPGCAVFGMDEDEGARQA